MKKALQVFLLLLSVIGAVAATVMLAMAIRHGELGRVIFYLVLAIICIEAAVLSILHLVRKKNSES